MFILSILAGINFLAAGIPAETHRQLPDTIRTVTVTADRGAIVSRTDTLSVNSSQTVTDLLIQVPGAQVNDDGGYAGLKTVSIRGMGSSNTSIYIDGVRVGNVQSGQGDLGAYGLDNFSSAVIDYAQSSLSFTTRRPSFIAGRRIGGKAAFAAGYFGTFLPSLRIDGRLSKNLTVSANADAVFSKGDFPCGNGQIRQNNDISQVRGGLDFFGTLPGGDWHAKLWCNSSDRGVPGPTTYPSTDRQNDLNTFAQCLLRNQFSPLYSLTASAKFSYDRLNYFSEFGNSQYHQTEAQLNSSHQFILTRWLVLSATADIYWDGLESTYCNHQRLGTTEALTAIFTAGRFKADLSVKYDGVFDSGTPGRNIVSPSLDAKYTAFEGFDIVAFARRAYRVPTFNELYYEGFGNPELKPEDAWLTDIGVQWLGRFGHWGIKAKLDGYYNLLHDKIVSSPSPDNPYIWHPYNIGQARAAGVDVFAGAEYTGIGWNAELGARYGYEDAQIPYVAQHSLSLNASAGTGGWKADLVWNLRAGRSDANGEMPDWNTLDLYLTKSFDLGKAGVPTLKLSFKNITDNRYELVSGYPMPGFSITGAVEYKF